MMPHVVEVGTEVKVDHERLAVGDLSGNVGHRVMRRPSRSVAVGPRLKVSFKDGFQDEFERTLNHPVMNRGD